MAMLTGTMEPLVVMITAPAGEAPGLARSLVELRLAACVNMLPGLRSWFWWEGQVDEAEETLLLAKTTRERLDALLAAVRERHSYQVFEAIAMPIVEGYAPYLEWIGASVAPPPANGPARPPTKE
jgi:periplasmic divalent cation tolerance protein